jgi:hypothetical protein
MALMGRCRKSLETRELEVLMRTNEFDREKSAYLRNFEKTVRMENKITHSKTEH